MLKITDPKVQCTKMTIMLTSNMSSVLKCDQMVRFPSHFSYRWWFMVFIDTFNNISVKSWRSVLLVEETGEPGENHRPVTSH